MESNINQGSQKSSQPNIKSRNIRILLYILLALLTSLCLFFLPNYAFVYDVLLGKAMQNVSESSNAFSSPLFGNYIQYYTAVKLLESNTKQAKILLVDLLEKKVRKGLRKKTHILLGESYILERDYHRATEQLWKLLVLEPSDMNRVNYELARSYADIFEQVQERDSENLKKKPQNNTKDTQRDAIIALETIEKSNTYFLHITDKEEKTELPQW